MTEGHATMDLEECVRRLQAFPTFATAASTAALPFAYAAPDDGPLAALREAHGLVPIAADADVLQEALASMAWVFGRFRHTGPPVALPASNAREILAHADAGTFYCDHKAVVLNEVLLARGLKSRVITCMPQQFDGDRHVAVIVFVPEAHKWVLLDPTFNTYFPAGAASARGPVEVRDAFCQGRVPDFAAIPIHKTWKLVLAGQEYASYQEWYTVYMAKNCFRFSSPTVSACGSYAATGTQMAYLDPLGYCVRNEYDDARGRCHPNVYTCSLSAYLGPPMPVARRHSRAGQGGAAPTPTQ